MKKKVLLLPPPGSESNDLLKAAKGEVVDAEFSEVPANDANEVIGEMYEDLKEANQRNEENPDKFPTVEKIYSAPEVPLQVSFSEFSHYIVQEIGYTVKNKINKVKGYLHLLFTNPIEFNAKFCEWRIAKGHMLVSWAGKHTTAAGNFIGCGLTGFKEAWKDYFAGTPGALDKNEFHTSMEVIYENMAEQREAFFQFTEDNARALRRMQAQISKLKGEPTKEEKARLDANKAKADAAAAKRAEKEKTIHNKAIVDFAKAVKKGRKAEAIALYRTLTGASMADSKGVINEITA